MSSIDDYLEVRRAAEEARRLADKALGGLEQLKREFKKKYGSPSSTGKEAVVVAEAELKSAERKLHELLKEFQSKWKDVLEVEQ